jgi:hypothetical protein
MLSAWTDSRGGTLSGSSVYGSIAGGVVSSTLRSRAGLLSGTLLTPVNVVPFDSRPVGVTSPSAVTATPWSSPPTTVGCQGVGSAVAGCRSVTLYSIRPESPLWSGGSYDSVSAGRFQPVPVYVR